MAKDKITEYDSTANNNTLCGDVNIAENSALPSDMNNFAREIMSHLKEGLGSGTPLYVDQTNNRVGINKTPTVALDVSGDADFSGTLDVTGDLTVDTNTLKVDSANNRVGIGTTSPDLKLDVSHGTSSEYVATFQNTADNLELKIGTTSGLLNIQGANASTNAPYLISLNAEGGNVGIGESSPDKLLHLKTSQSVTCEIKIEAPRDRGRLSFHSQTNSGTDYEMGKIEIDRSSGTLQTAHMIFATNGGSGNIERMRISSSGQTLYGATSSRSSESKIELHSPANTALSLYMFKTTQVEVNMGFKGSTDTNFYINSGSTSVGASGAGVYLTNAGTSWTSNSDFRKKKNLVAIENALDKIANCRAMIGHFNNEQDDVKKRPFLIAQDWLIALPEAVDENTLDDDGNENLGLSYEGTIPLLVACIKELREENIDLKARITALETA